MDGLGEEGGVGSEVESGDVLERADVTCDEVTVVAKGRGVRGGRRGEEVSYESFLVVKFAEWTRYDGSLEWLLRVQQTQLPLPRPGD